jgi:hypothetical protein
MLMVLLKNLKKKKNISNAKTSNALKISPYLWALEHIELSVSVVRYL